MNSPFLIGKKVDLRGLALEDMTHVARWMNDGEVTHYLFMGDRPAHSRLLEEQWEKDVRNPNEISLAMVDQKSGKRIGWCGLYGIQWISRTAEFRVFIGAKSFWNKGVGKEAARLLLRYGFEKLNLNKIWLGVNAEHLGAYHSYLKAGFVREGVLRQEIFRNNRYYDAVRMSVLRSEYEKSR